jgi:hypothetical protein
MPRRSSHPLPAVKRMAKYRRRMRAAGLKPLQIWVPDTHAPGFAEKCRVQSLAIARQDAAGAEAQHFIESTYEWPDP